MEKNFSKKTPEVEEYARKIEEVRKVDNAKHFDLACDLFDMAQERGNEDLKDYASCILGDACCQNNDFSQALYYLTAGIDGVAQTDEYLLMTRTYNQLGIIYRSAGHMFKSLENYMASIDVAREHRLYLSEAIACSNFASLCDEMGATSQALEYHYRSVECCEFIEDEDDRKQFLVGEYALMAKLYAQLGDESTAKSMLDIMEGLIEEYPEFNEVLDVIVARFNYYHIIGDKENIAKCKKQCLEAFHKCDDFVIYYDEVVTLVDLLLQDREYEELARVFDKMDDIEVSEELTSLYIHLERFRVEMYKALGDRVGMMEASYKFFEYSSKRNEESQKSFVSMLRLKSELAQQKTTNFFLSAVAETDTLTGLANRMKLNTVIDELFMLANKEGKRLGVEMMDVDYFKQVNDTYGHAKGDELLKEMGKAFKEFVSEKIFVARYGGDEFIIYYYDMTDDEILEIVRKIQECMTRIGEELGLGKVTASQGIVNRVPEPQNRAWDYLNSADYALYYVKEHGKANARLIHGRADLANKEWVKVF